MKRSGLKVIGLTYVLGSCVSFLVNAEHKYQLENPSRSERLTDQMFGMTRDPFGIKNPSWISSCITR